MARTETVGIRLAPEVKATLVRAAKADGRTLAGYLAIQMTSIAQVYALAERKVMAERRSRK